MGALLADVRSSLSRRPVAPARRRPFPSRSVGQKAVAPALLCRYNARPGIVPGGQNAAGYQPFSYPRYWAECYGTAPFLPMSRAEMDKLGWDSCDIVLGTGDAYVDHPSFGMAVTAACSNPGFSGRHHRPAGLVIEG